MKLCKDCAHFDGKHYCQRAYAEPDYVFGTPPAHYSAQIEREHISCCGPQAIYFKAKVELVADDPPF